MPHRFSGRSQHRRLTARRSFLQAGALGSLGLNFAGALRAAATDPCPLVPGKAKAVILLWLQGGVSHHDTFDLKPRAPAEIRGPFNEIATKAPGVKVGELLPNTAQIMDRVALVRSVTHREAAHERGMRNMLAGHKPDAGAALTNRPDMGAVVGHALGSRAGLPPYVVVPGNDFTATIKHYNTGYLPASSGPFYAKDAETFAGAGTAIDRLSERLPLRDSLDSLSYRPAGKVDRLQDWDRFQEQAVALVTSGQARRAFDISGESAATLAAYGIVDRGSQQAENFLKARRLVEAGVRFVTVGEDGWDHHQNIFPQLKNCVPRFDKAFAGLLGDLAQRGLLEETLVVSLTEFGRTPYVNKDAGRDHWPGVFSICFAGAGVRGGAVLGSSDEQGSMPEERPVSPEEIAATIYQLAGIPPHAEYVGADKRPRRYLETNPPPLREIME